MDQEKTNILVVDDLPEKRLVYETILAELDQNLVMARSGPEALKEILLRDFAVILLDVNMPGMDGLETAALIRQRKKSAHTPIIFITAFADDVRAAQGYAHGAVDYILAPVVPEVLQAKVKVFVDLFRMTRQVERQAEERSKLEAAEESNRRLGFLARAGAVLGQSLDFDATVRDLARLPVPQLADLAAVVCAVTAGAAPAVIACRTDANGEPQVIAPTEPLAAEVAAATQVMATGTDLVTPSALALPLRARGRTFAALVLSRAPSGRTFALADRSVAADLAGRAAIALDNARLFREIQLADRHKNEFLSMLAHELRNPLAPIRNAVEVLKLEGVNATGLPWAREVIDRQVRHLVRLVDDLLDVSRITRGKIRLQIESVPVAAVVAQAVEASRPEIESRGHTLDVTLPPQPAWVKGDPARLAQVLTNLLNNAAKYTEAGGTIWLDAGAVGAEVVFHIRDTGVGIPADKLAEVFEFFAQVDRTLDRAHGGLGIGLTLVKRLVELHGGSVAVHSDGLGRGSTFTVRLPAAAADPNRQPSAPPFAARPADPRRVLVVDDNLDGAATLARLLRLAGHDVRLAHDGPAAVEAALAFRPDAIVLDIGLPGLDGYEVARRLRGEAAMTDTVLIALTGYGRSEDRSRATQAGFDHHLIKPLDLDALQRMLAAAPHRPLNGESTPGHTAASIG